MAKKLKLKKPSKGNGKLHKSRMSPVMQQQLLELTESTVRGFTVVDRHKFPDAWRYDAQDGNTYYLNPIKTQGTSTCCACGVVFQPKRPPAAGRSSYCPSCGKKAALRDAARRYRAKKKAELGGTVADDLLAN